MSENGSGTLEVGTNDRHEVVINLPRDMTGHIVFSVEQAEGLAATLTRKAREAQRARVDAAEAARIANLPPVDRSQMCTTNGRPVDDVRASQTNETGQHDGYIVLCPDERAKGFVRPYRDSYKHVGVRPKFPTRPLNAREEELFGGNGYVAFEDYPEGTPERSKSTGRFWTQAQLNSGCGGVTTMGRVLSETYARDPKFYGATFCCTCNRHVLVAEFVWTADGQQVGS